MTPPVGIPSQALIPGKCGRLPTNGMLQEAKKKVLGFLQREEAKEAKQSTSAWDPIRPGCDDPMPDPDVCMP